MEKYMYEKAIKAYEFQVGRFNTWMNYYALFVGALFIAYYTTKNSYIKLSEIGHFSIVFMGLFSSICWLLSLLGHYSWIKSWTKIVHFHEEQLPGLKDRHRVYTLFYEKSLKKYGYSTQKVTLIFIGLVIFAWVALLSNEYLIYFNPDIDTRCCLWIVISILSLSILACVIFNRKLLSKTKHMYKLEVKQDKKQPKKFYYEVSLPKEIIELKKTDKILAPDLYDQVNMKSIDDIKAYIDKLIDKIKNKQ